MRILLITQYYYPEPVEKVHDLARGLVQRGHQVTVITGFPCYPKGEIYPGYKQSTSFTEEIEGVRVIRVPQFPDHSRSAFRRVLYYLFFPFSALIFGLRRAKGDCDAVLIYLAALPVGLTGIFLKWFTRRKIVLDVVDIWPESVEASGMLRNRFLLRLIRSFANAVYQHADRISVVTEGFKKNLIQHRVPPEKLTVIHNWMPSSTYTLRPRDAEFARKEMLEAPFLVMYAGNVGPSQHVITLLEAADLIKDKPNIKIAIIGDGLCFSDIEKYHSARQLSNVLLLGRRPPESMADFYALADVLVVHLKPDILSDVTIPSKTFAYMASGKPVIMAVAGDAQSFVETNQFGVAVPPCNPRALADAILKLSQLPKSELARMGAAALSAYNSRYCSSVQIGHMEAVLNFSGGSAAQACYPASPLKA